VTAAKGKRAAAAAVLAARAAVAVSPVRRATCVCAYKSKEMVDVIVCAWRAPANNTNETQERGTRLHKASRLSLSRLCVSRTVQKLASYDTREGGRESCRTKRSQMGHMQSD
jgi:hypothetical protein